MIKKLIKSTSLKDLNLSANLQRILREYTPQEIVTAARQDQLEKLNGLDSTLTAELIETLKASGYLLEESDTSNSIRRLLVELGIIADFGSNEEYEARREFTTKQISSMLDILDALAQREAYAIKMRFGLLHDPAAYPNQSSMTQEQIEQAADRGLRRFHQPARYNQIIKIFPEFIRKR